MAKVVIKKVRVLIKDVEVWRNTNISFGVLTYDIRNMYDGCWYRKIINDPGRILSDTKQSYFSSLKFYSTIPQQFGSKYNIYWNFFFFFFKSTFTPFTVVCKFILLKPLDCHSSPLPSGPHILRVLNHGHACCKIVFIIKYYYILCAA